MRINLENHNMDIVMHIVRKHGVMLQDVINFIINNPEEIEIARGEMDYDKRRKSRGKKP